MGVRGRNNKKWLLICCAAVLVVFAADVLFAERTPLHIHIQSAGTNAILTMDGATHIFAWPSPPARVSILPNDPTVHEWGIDGSESTTTSIANLDPAYLQSIKGNPYIMLDRWLRNEDAYDEWRNVCVSTSVAGVANTHIITDLVAGLPVPNDFTLDADVYHLEQPVTLAFNAASGPYQLRIDRSYHTLAVTATPPGQPTTTIGQWYFPTDPWPFLALNITTVSYALAWGALLLALTVAIGAILPSRATASLSGLRRRWSSLYRNIALPLSTVAIAASFVFTLYIARVIYHGMPHIYDAQAYFMQAKIFALGRTTIPLPPLPDSFPVPFFGDVAGHWATEFGPGTALTLVPGLWIGLPWLVQPLLGVGTLALVGLIGRRLYGPYVGTLAVLLGALSPFHSFLVGSYFSHTASAFFGTLAYYLLLRARWGRRLWPTAGAGIAIGLLFACRELSALLIGLPLGVSLVLHLWRWGRLRRALAALLVGGAGAGFVGVFYVLYNRSITGNPLLTPRSVLDPSNRYGFGASGIGFWGQHTLAAGLVNLDQLVTGLSLELFGWPYYMALAMPLLPFALARANRWDVLNAALAVAVMAGTVGYFYHGIAIGPRYLYEAVPALLLLTARGVQVLGIATSDLLAVLRRPRPAGLVAAHLVLALLILPNVVFYLPRHLDFYRNFVALSGLPHLDLSRIYGGAPPHAIIVSSDGGIYANVLSSLNNPADFVSPATTSDDIWALASTPARYVELTTAFPHRTLYILVTDGSSVSFQPWRATVG